MTAKADPRVKKLESIQQRLAKFAMSEIYTDEPEAMRKVAEAIGVLDEVKPLLKQSEAAQ